MIELIVIKVGLDIGVIDDRLFTMLMVMAIVTTLMTGPLLSLFAERPAEQPEEKIHDDAMLSAQQAESSSR